MFNRHEVDEKTVRYEYHTADGEPVKRIFENGKWWERRGYHSLSYDASIGLVWYICY